MLPVDAYYKDIGQVIEYWERQHLKATPFMDKRPTCSGCNRGEQRRMYDQRKRDALAANGIKLLPRLTFTTETSRSGARSYPELGSYACLHRTPWALVTENRDIPKGSCGVGVRSSSRNRSEVQNSLSLWAL
jgi:hypothetical protein